MSRSSRGYRVAERAQFSDDLQLERARRAARRHGLAVSGYEDDAYEPSDGGRVFIVRPRVYERVVIVED